MRARVDSSLCQAHGCCAITAPAVFEQDADGYGLVVMEVVPPELEDAVKASVTGCPEGAIQLS